MKSGLWQQWAVYAQRTLEQHKKDNDINHLNWAKFRRYNPRVNNTANLVKANRIFQEIKNSFF